VESLQGICILHLAPLDVPAAADVHEPDGGGDAAARRDPEARVEAPAPVADHGVDDALLGAAVGAGEVGVEVLLSAVEIRCELTEYMALPSAGKYEIIPHDRPKLVAPKCVETMAGLSVKRAP
jgi:hypothetical protein